MENPFSSDKNNPFQTPYQAAPDTTGIKPFTAVDLGPPVGRADRQAGPASGPYAGGDFGSAFLAREPAAPHSSQVFAHPPAPAPIAAPEALAPSWAAGAQPAAGPRPEIRQDFTPAPIATDLHRASDPQLLSMSDFDSALGPKKPGFFCTTTPSVEGYAIAGYLGIVSVEIVIPKDVLFQNPAPYGELHRIKAAEEQLQRIKETAMRELSEKAGQLRADAVVGVALHFSHFDAIVCLCTAVGTAVKLSG